MGWFILAVIFTIIAAVLLIVGKFSYKPYGKQEQSFSFRPWALIPLGLALLMLLLSTMRVVHPGNVGVPVTFGKAGSATGSGIQFVAPWTGMQNMSVQLENYTMSSSSSEGSKTGDDSVPVNTKDQVQVNVDSTVLFRLTRSQARSVYVNIGKDFVAQVVRPTIRSAIRDAAVGYDAIDLATDDRAAFQAQAFQQIRTALKPDGIDITSLQIRDMHLPNALQTSINAKAAAQQDVAKQAFVLQSVQRQAEQRVAQAKGLRESQNIIQQTLTPLYLENEYIQAMTSLAKSKNTTFLFLPSDPANLPNFVLPTPASVK